MGSKKKFYKTDFFSFVFFFVVAASFLIALYFVMTYGQANIDSDTADASRLAKSMVTHKCIVSPSVLYVDGSIWCCLQNSFFSLIPSSIFHNQPFARMVASALMITVAVILIIMLSKRVFQSDAYRVAVPVILLGMGGWTGYYMILIEAAYTRVIILEIILIIALVGCVKSKTRLLRVVLIIVLGLFSFFLGLDSLRNIPELLLPIWITPIVYYLLSGYKCSENDENGYFPGKYVFTATLVSLACCVIGLVVYRFLVEKHIHMVDTVDNALIFADSLTTLFNELIIAFRTPFELFGYSGNARVFSLAGVWNLVSLTSAILICYIFPFLQIKQYKKEKSSVQLYIVYTITQSSIMFLADILLAKHGGYRLLSSWSLIIIMSCRYIYEKIKSIKKAKVKYIVYATFLLLVMVDGMMFIKRSDGWREQLNERISLNNIILEKGVNKGYAQYWTAYSNELYSDFKINYNAVDIYQNYIKPSAFFLDLDDYYEEADKSFLMLSEEEKDLIDSNIESLY